MKKIIVFLGSALISHQPSVRNFYSRVKKKLIEGPAFSFFDLFYADARLETLAQEKLDNELQLNIITK